MRKKEKTTESLKFNSIAFYAAEDAIKFDDTYELVKLTALSEVEAIIIKYPSFQFMRKALFNDNFKDLTLGPHMTSLYDFLSRSTDPKDARYSVTLTLIQELFHKFNSQVSYDDQSSMEETFQLIKNSQY